MTTANEAIPVSVKKEYEKPTEGEHQLQIDNVTVEKLKKFESDQMIDKYLFRFVCLDQKDSDGFPVSLITYFTQSLFVDSNLYQFLTKILGLKIRETTEGTNEWSFDKGVTYTPAIPAQLIGAKFTGYVEEVTKRSGKVWMEIVSGTRDTLRVPNAKQQADFIVRRDKMYEELKAAQKAGAPAQAQRAVASAQKIQSAPQATANSFVAALDEEIAF